MTKERYLSTIQKMKEIGFSILVLFERKNQMRIDLLSAI